jgi:transcriptional regulator of acetoin/glycerol metabolism
MQLEDLPPDLYFAPVAQGAARIRTFHEALDETARELCVAAFRASRGSCVKAANLMGLHRNSVYRLIRNHRLEHLLDA